MSDTHKEINPAPLQPFVHLHLHTAYSLLDGACRIPDIMSRAVETGMPAVAMTDHGVMYGAVDFVKAAMKAKVRPIIGCEMYIAKGSRHDRTGAKEGNPHYHLVLLAETNEGYRNLSKLVSLAHIEGMYHKPRIDREILSELKGGLIGLSACLHGEVASFLAGDDLDGAIRAAGEYAEILGKDNFFIEIMDHGLKEELRVNRYMKELSRRAALPLVATNDVHYLKREHAEAHDLLLCLQTGKSLNDPNRMRYPTDRLYMTTYEEMARLFADYPGAVERTVDIANRCIAEIEIGALHFPIYRTPDGSTQRDFLVTLARNGLRERYGIADPSNPANERERAIMERFWHEMHIVEQTKFINYFLVVWDFVHFAHSRGIPVGPGRGSGGGSVLAYVLYIISIDPLQYNLIFERFLNPDRVDPPDFDIDFCQVRRGEVIDYVKNKYGEDHVAQIVTFGTLGPKTVLRDVGRMLDIPYSKCNDLAKMVPDDPKMTLDMAVQISPEFSRAVNEDVDLKRIMPYATVLEGLYRNQGTHAAGVVIGEKPLIDIVPLAVDKDRQPITQYSMKAIAEIGLLKMDFLGLKTLTVIRETIELVERFHGRKLDFASMPCDDPKTYQLMSRADTVGVFQLESAGMRDSLRQIGARNIEEIIAVIALYRPGPMNMLPAYRDRKSGKERIVYDHPLLEPILKETFGVMVYQEQVQQAAKDLAGYTLGQADLLRRAMSKKEAAVMEKERARFVLGCREHNAIAPELAGRIFDNIAKFAEYGFNKAHSAGYAILCYQTAFLKANYPAEFMAALISSEIGNFDKMPGFIAEAETMGLPILPPDVNRSDVRFVPEEKGIRYGLAGIKNVGHSVSKAIVAERLDSGPFKSLVDLCSRVESQLLNKKALESLARCGAMDSFGDHRARVFNGIDFAVARAAGALADKKRGQDNWFDLLNEAGSSPVSDESLPEATPWPENEQLASEKELLGIYLTGHPLTRYAALLKRYRLATLAEVAELKDESLTRVGGIVSAIEKTISKKSQRQWARLTLEDNEGSVQVLCFGDVFDRFSNVLRTEAPIMVCGEVSRREELPRIYAKEVYLLDEAPRLFSKRVAVHVSTTQLTDKLLDEIEEALKSSPGEVPVVICILFAHGPKAFIETSGSFFVNPTEELLRRLQRIVGEDAVVLAVNPAPCLEPVESRQKDYRRRSGAFSWHGQTSRSGGAAEFGMDE